MSFFDAEILTDEETGVIFSPVVFNGCLGYQVQHPDGRRELVLLAPTTAHQVNSDNGAEGDTFLYHLRGEDFADWTRAESAASPVDFADAITYVNHFEEE